MTGSIIQVLHQMGGKCSQLLRGCGLFHRICQKRNNSHITFDVAFLGFQSIQRWSIGVLPAPRPKYKGNAEQWAYFRNNQRRRQVSVKRQTCTPASGKCSITEITKRIFTAPFGLQFAGPFCRLAPGGASPPLLYRDSVQPGGFSRGYVSLALRCPASTSCLLSPLLTLKHTFFTPGFTAMSAHIVGGVR
jgi:hypothetical protein